MGLIRIVGRKKMVLVLKFYSVAAGTEKYESKGTLRKKKKAVIPIQSAENYGGYGHSFLIFG